MKIDYIAVIGLIAGTLTTASLLPQVIKTIRIKETRDISISMYIILATGMLLWVIYGALIDALPIILANTFSLILALIVLILKIKYG